MKVLGFNRTIRNMIELPQKGDTITHINPSLGTGTVGNSPPTKRVELTVTNVLLIDDGLEKEIEVIAEDKHGKIHRAISKVPNINLN